VLSTIKRKQSSGGGKDSIYFIDSQIGRTYVLKDDGPVRMVVSGTTEINEIIAQSGLTVEEVDLTGDGVEGITVDKKVDGNVEINLKGVKVESLEINTAGVTVRTDKNTVIDKLVVNEKTAFKGSGTIKDADINADDVTFEKMPEKYELAEGVKPSTRSSSGGGGGGSSKVAVSAISVEPAELVLTLGKTEKITAVISPANATNKKVTWSSDHEEVATVDENSNVTAVATGTATITATTEDGGLAATCSVTVWKIVNITREKGYDAIQRAIDDADNTIRGNHIGIAADNINNIQKRNTAQIELFVLSSHVSKY
jgi:uncharacterized protein YjdB